MATPPYGRRGKGRTKPKKGRPTKVAGQPSSSAFEHANANARFKRAAGAKPGKGRPKKAISAPANPRPRTKTLGTVSTGMYGTPKPMAGGEVAATRGPSRMSRFSGSAGGEVAATRGPSRMSRFSGSAGGPARKSPGGRPVGPKPATTNSGADTAPKSPRPVAGTKGPHPSAQAIAHASTRARFKRDAGTTAPAPQGIAARPRKPKLPGNAGRFKKGS